MSQFTADTRAAILARIELGVTFNDAATAAGVKVATAKGWLSRGRRTPDGNYGEFARAVDVAREAAPNPVETGDAAELKRRVWAMVEAGSVEAAKLYHRMLSDGEGGSGSSDPWRVLGVSKGEQ